MTIAGEALGKPRWDGAAEVTAMINKSRVIQLRRLSCSYADGSARTSTCEMPDGAASYYDDDIAPARRAGDDWAMYPLPTGRLPNRHIVIPGVAGGAVPYLYCER